MYTKSHIILCGFPMSLEEAWAFVRAWWRPLPYFNIETRVVLFVSSAAFLHRKKNLASSRFVLFLFLLVIHDLVKCICFGTSLVKITCFLLSTSCRIIYRFCICATKLWYKMLLDSKHCTVRTHEMFVLRNSSEFAEDSNKKTKCIEQQ